MIVNVLKLKKDNPEIPFYRALAKIYGIGFSTARAICLKKKLDYNTYCKEVSNRKALEVSTFVNENLLIDVSLGSFLKRKKDRHLNCLTYRGVRHKMFLPVRGQRTHSNASLGKNKRVIPKEKGKLSRRELALKYKKRPQFFPKV